MLSKEFGGQPYSKTEHRRQLRQLIPARSDGSIEFKHQNISAVLIDLGFPYIAGYLPRFNYQDLLYEIVAERLAARADLEGLAATDAEAPASVPAVDEILGALVEPPPSRDRRRLTDRGGSSRYFTRKVWPAVNYLEREARNRSLGSAGEEFVMRYEQTRLIRAGRERLAARIDRVSLSRGDGAGYDILSFEETGKERLIEVKTTKYGRETPFFLSQNEVDCSQDAADKYNLYRLFDFRAAPRLFSLAGPLSKTCALDPVQYIATVA